jgi:hypothetical protein
MDMDSAIKVMVWCVLAFSVTMFGLGHVMSGNGAKGYKVMQAETQCGKSGAAGIEIDGKYTYVCGDVR